MTMPVQKYRRKDEFMPMTINEPSWLVIRYCGGQTLRVEELKPNAALLGALIVEEHEYQCAGWKSEGIEHGRWKFFMNRAGVRICVAIQEINPTAR